MVNFIRRMFCKHDYELTDDIKIGNYNSSPDPDKVVPNEGVKIYRCKKCGAIQRVSTKKPDYAGVALKWVVVAMLSTFTVGCVKEVIKK